jgi:hypothetical protein
MCERDRRNEVMQEDLFVEAEFLVFGLFQEDSTDDGFKATRWVPVAEVEAVDGGRGLAEAFEKLDDTIVNAKSTFNIEID